MNNNKDTGSALLLSKRDIAILIVACDIVYFFGSAYMGGNLYLCAFSIFLITLVSAYLLMMVSILERNNEEKVGLVEKEKNIVKKLRDEYQTIHKIKKKNKLLNPFKEEGYSARDHISDLVTKVHLDYLKGVKEGGKE